MSNEANTLVPELRFPEFVEEGKWETRQLIEVCEINPSNTNLPNEFVYIDLESVDSGMLLKRNIINNESAPSRAQRLLENGDVIYQMVRPYQKNNFFFDIDDELNYVASTGYALLRAYQSKMYIYQYVHSDNFVNRVLSKCTGSNYPAINSSDLARIKVEIPNFPEQQKIASCLSSLDEVIASHSQKLGTLKEHKKSLMQNLFPQEGQRVPAYRFDEFLEDGDWEEKTLGDKEVSFFVSEKISVNRLNIDSYISTENMLPEFSGVFTASKLPPSGNFTKFNDGDILISNIRPYLKKVWKSDKVGGASNDVLVFRSGSEVLSQFLEFILKNEVFINFVMESAKGVKMPRGDKNSMKKYSVFIPSKVEQQEIASCLSALDDLISAQAEKIEQLKLHKQGLMQGLFPKVSA